MKFYRVFPWIESADVHALGGALHVPPQGTGRVDNPDHYGVLYTCESPEAAIAETFNRPPYRLHWNERMLRPRTSGAVTALAEIEGQESHDIICDLDEPEELTNQALRPSGVITRDRVKTQSWALRIFEQRRFAGIRWWSYHEAQWSVVAFWNPRILRPSVIRALSLEDDSLREAARILSISIDRRR